MMKSEAGGVEGLARSIACVGLWWLALDVRIDLLAAERVTDFGEVDADLVRSARFEAALQDRVTGQVLERTEVGDSAAGGDLFFFGRRWR
jgi:hypothetical protein